MIARDFANIDDKVYGIPLYKKIWRIWLRITDNTYEPFTFQIAYTAVLISLSSAAGFLIYLTYH